MSIGSNIKRLRVEKKITQEQLAEYLGITSRAVSQWECDRTTPNISLIAPLTNIFGVTADELLGIDIEKSNEKIEEYLLKAKKARIEEDGLEKRTAILREANSLFPRSYKIMERLANSLVCEYSRKGIKDYDEVFSICNRVLSECTDSFIRYEALYTLGCAYNYAEKREEMLEVAEQMPPFEFCREFFMLYKMNGDKGWRERQKYLNSLTEQLLETLGCLTVQTHDDGSFVYSMEDRIEMLKQKVAIIELLYPDGDFHSMAQEAEGACSLLASLYLQIGDTENCIYWLMKCCDYVIHFDTYYFEDKHTSPAFRRYCGGGWIKENCLSHSAEFLDYLSSDKKFDKIRTDPRVENATKRLEMVAKNP